MFFALSQNNLSWRKVTKRVCCLKMTTRIGHVCCMCSFATAQFIALALSHIQKGFRFLHYSCTSSACNASDTACALFATAQFIFLGHITEGFPICVLAELRSETMMCTTWESHVCCNAACVCFTICSSILSQIDFHTFRIQLADL